MYVTGPRCFESEGQISPSLVPGAEGAWTCSPDTRTGDLALIYRTTPKRDVAHLLEVTSDPKIVSRGEFKGGYACGYVSRLQFDSPLSLQEMKADSVLTDWGPTRANFRTRSYQVEDRIWKRFIELLEKSNRGTKAAVRVLEQGEVSADIRYERDIQARLAQDVGQIRRGLSLVENGVEYICHPVGKIDLLCRSTRGLVAIELKRDVADYRALGQLLGYMGWLRTNLAKKQEEVSGILIGSNMDAKVQAALRILPDVTFIPLESLVP